MKKGYFVGLVLSVLFLASSSYGAPSPEFYGIYVINNNKLIDLSETNKSTYDFGQSVQFIVFQKNPERYADSLTITRAIFLQTVYFHKEESFLGPGAQSQLNVNRWRPRKNGAVATRTKPVAGKSEQIYVVPSSPLPAGAYFVGDKSSGNQIGAFFVNKDEMIRNVNGGGDCTDIDYEGYAPPVRSQIPEDLIRALEMHGKEIPCKKQ